MTTYHDCLENNIVSDLNQAFSSSEERKAETVAYILDLVKRRLRYTALDDRTRPALSATPRAAAAPAPAALPASPAQPAPALPLPARFS